MITTLDELKAAIELGEGGEDFVEKVAYNAEMARHVLSISGGNRRLRERRISELHDCMISGDFFAGNDMFCFDEEGKFINGHHRCESMSVLPEDKKVEIYTRFGVPRKELSILDTGERRNYEDYVGFKGISVQKNYFLKPSTIRAICKSILTGGQSFVRLSHIQIDDFIERYEDDIVALSKFFPQKISRITVAPVMAVVLKARISLREQNQHANELVRLEKVLEFLSKGMDNIGTEKFAGSEILVKLLKFLLDDKTRTSDAGSHAKVYRRTMFCVYSFVFGKNYKNILETKEDYFPIDLSWFNIIPDEAKAPLLLRGKISKKITDLPKDKCGEYKTSELADVLELDSTYTSNMLNRAFRLTESIQVGDKIVEKSGRGMCKVSCAE